MFKEKIGECWRCTLAEALASTVLVVVPAGRLCVSHNTRLGVYDPIRNMWQIPPSNVEEHDDQMRLKAHGHIPIKRKVPASPNVGVYDPVR